MTNAESIALFELYLKDEKKASANTLASYLRDVRQLGDFLTYRHRYTYTFDSSDQLGDLNAKVTELTEENRTLRRRNAALRDISKPENES